MDPADEERWNVEVVKFAEHRIPLVSIKGRVHISKEESGVGGQCEGDMPQHPLSFYWPLSGIAQCRAPARTAPIDLY